MTRSDHDLNAASALVRADDLVAGYLPGVNILNGCDLYANKGELVGIIGPNGAGKTTAFNLISGMFAPDKGTITLNGQRIEGKPAHVICRMGLAR